MAEKENTQNRIGSKFERRKLSPSSSSILLRCVTKFERLLSTQNTQNRVGSLVGLSRQTRTVSPFWVGLLRFVENPPPPSAMAPPWPIFNNTAPKLVINHLQALKSSEESLREQLEEAKKKEAALILTLAAFIVTLAKREQEVAKLKEENEEIGNQASEAKMHELATELSLQKYQNAELKSQLEGLQKNMDALTNDVERSDEVVMLRAKLDEKEQEIQRLEYEMQRCGDMAIIRHMLKQCRNGPDHRSTWI